ncbi:MAG TPA: glycosyltransferase family 39 protein [Bacteroidales bacterium]|jgi:voltage-gated potassium channel Kch|nr:glycosyltransferase family 39 protein [Bacteroidales bacterium]
MKKRFGVNSTTMVIILLAIINATIHLVFSYNLEYHRDELLYFSLGQHPAFGYATVPPMTGWVAWLMKSLFGYSIFAVRIFPAFLSILMVVLVSETARELGGSDFSRILAAVGFTVSIIGLRTYLMFQPVHIDLFFWTLLFYLLVKYINTERGKYLVLFGITAGLTLLNKYLVGVFFLSLLLVVPFTRYRYLFTDRKFWLSLLAALIVFSPNLIWQIANKLPVLNHFSELQRTQLVNVDRGAFLFEQLMMPGAASFLTVAGLIFLYMNKNMKPYRFLGSVSIGVILILMLLQGKSYYTQGIFPFLMAAGAVSWEAIFKKAWLRTALVVLIVAMTWPVIPIGVPVYKTEGLVKYFDKLKRAYGMDFVCRFEDNSVHSLPQDYADMLGWEELTLITNKAWQMIPDKKAAFIYAENYGQAGAITVIGKKYQLPEAVCFSESFLYWLPREFNPDIKYVVYINDEPGQDIYQVFGKVTKIGAISNPDAREFGTGVYLCEDPVAGFNGFWKERLKQLF